MRISVVLSVFAALDPRSYIKSKQSVIAIVCASHTCLKQDVGAEAEIQEIVLLPSSFMLPPAFWKKPGRGAFIWKETVVA